MVACSGQGIAFLSWIDPHSLYAFSDPMPWHEDPRRCSTGLGDLLDDLEPLHRDGEGPFRPDALVIPRHGNNIAMLVF